MKYELEFEDEQSAHAFANQMDIVLDDPHSGMSVATQELIADARDAVRAQIPIPAPTKIGAVVRAIGMYGDGPDASAVFIRWALDSRTHNPWIQAGNHEQPYRTDEIGRITKVLSEGVDL